MTKHSARNRPRTMCLTASISPASASWSPACRPVSASRRRGRWLRTAPKSSARRAISTRRGAATEVVRAAAAATAAAGAGRARSRLAGQRAGLRGRAAGRWPAVRPRHRQRRRHGHAARQDRGRFRDPVRHQPSRPFRVRQPHRLAAEAGRAAGEPVVGRPPLFRRRSRRSEFRAHTTTRLRRLRPLEDRQHPVRRRVRPPSQGARRARRGRASGRHPDRARAAT